jgi:hypothetical protein
MIYISKGALNNIEKDTAMTKILLLATFIFISACQDSQPSDVEDIAVNLTSIKAFYYAENDTVVRLGCDNNVILINRANCTTRVDRLYRWGLEDLLRKEYGINTENIEEKITQTLLKLQHTESQIDLLLSVEPDLKQDFVPEMNRLRGLLLTNAGTLDAFVDQMARIRSDLVNAEDPDQRLLLIEIQTKVTALQQERNQLQKELAEVRAKHFDANSSVLSTTTMQRLFNQRKAIVVSYESAVSELAEDMRRTQGYYEILKFLDDSSSWEFTAYDTDYTARAALAVEAVFRNYFKAISDHIYPVWSAETKRFVITIPAVNDRLSSLTVRFETGSSCQGVKIYGQGFSFELMGKKDINRSNFDPVAAPIFEKPIDGKWFVEPICTGTYNANYDRLYLYRVRN